MKRQTALCDTTKSIQRRALFNQRNKWDEMWVAKGRESNDIERYFTGQVYDEQSKLYYMNARYYDPETAVFICPDPAMEGSNHYAYVSCRPITFNDPTGCTEEEDSSSNIQWMSFSDWCNYAYDLSCQGIDPNGAGYGVGSDNYNNAMYGNMMKDMGISFSSSWTPGGQISNNLVSSGATSNDAGSIYNFGYALSHDIVSENIKNWDLKTWNGGQYAFSALGLYDKDNGYCLCSAMLRDCLKQMGSSITVRQARAIMNQIHEDGYTDEDGYFSRGIGSQVIQNRMWSLLGNTSGRWAHSTGANIEDMLGRNTYGYLNVPAMYGGQTEDTNIQHWISIESFTYYSDSSYSNSVNSKNSLLFLSITGFDPVRASSRTIYQYQIGSKPTDKILSIFYK